MSSSLPPQNANAPGQTPADVADVAGPLRVVVVGYGPVAARLIENLQEAVQDKTVALTVLGAETDEAYNRVLVAEYAVGRADRARLDVTDTAEAVLAGVDVRLGEAAVHIDRKRGLVVTDLGEQIPFDHVVLATGARANVPSLAGLERARRERSSPVRAADALDHGKEGLPGGVLAMRDIHDAQRVRPYVAGARHIVVLGAGVLGMEFALAAAEQGAQVTVLYHSETPMERNLDRGAGTILSRTARDLGVVMMPHARAESVHFGRDEEGHRSFEALVCADGSVVRGDVLVLSCGVTPRVELAIAAGLTCSRGIVVTPELASWDDARISAIGDCAHVAEPSEHHTAGSAGGGPDAAIPGGPSGLIGQGWQQAEQLAGRLLQEAGGGLTGARGRAEQDAAGALVARPVVTLKAPGIEVVSGGDALADPWDSFDARPPKPDEGNHPAHPDHPAAASPKAVSVWADPSTMRYVKVVSQDGVVTGFIAVGMAKAGAELSVLYQQSGFAPQDASLMLRLDGPDAAGEPASNSFEPAATLCWCNGVSVGDAQEAARCGEPTVECVSSSTRAGTGCGGCRGRIAELLAREST